MSDLDQRMRDAGMMTVSDMLGCNALGVYSTHTGVVDLEKFEEWLLMRREEYIKMQARMTLDKQEDDELYEWVIAHNAVFGEVLANFRQAAGQAS